MPLLWSLAGTLDGVTANDLCSRTRPKATENKPSGLPANTRPSPREKSLIHAFNCWKQLARAVRDNERDFRVGEMRSHRGDRRHGQDQVADPLQLDEKDVQPMAPSAWPARKHPAGVCGNGPT